MPLLKNKVFVGIMLAGALVAGGSGAAQAADPVLPPPAVSALAFKDIGASGFAADIRWMKERGITTGFPDGTFRPLQSVNRDAMAAFMYRLAGTPEFVAPEVSPFTDVPTSAQFFKEIAWLKETGISTGFPDATFRPEDSVSREAMAAFIQRFAASYCDIPAAKTFKAPPSPVFSDASVASLFFKETAWLKVSGISTGWADGTFRGGNEVSREAMSAFMHRMDGFAAANRGCNPEV